MKLKTLKEMSFYDDGDLERYDVRKEYLKRVAIQWIKNLQSPETEYPLILDDFPNAMKGEIAKNNWKNTMFTYGVEYGMLSWVMYFFNISEEDLE